jgi:uncharacterized lipoprotein YajG
MKTTLKLTALIAILFLTACDNTMTKKFGGKMTVELEKDQKLVNVSWKSSGKDASSLWLLTRVRKADEQPETYKYIEKSTFGVLEGVVTIVEK